MVEGTDGSMYHPNLNESSKLVILEDDLLRKFTLVFEDKVKFGKNVAYKYAVENSTYASTSDFAPNCAYGNDAPSGSFNVTMLKNVSNSCKGAGL